MVIPKRLPRRTTALIMALTGLFSCLGFIALRAPTTYATASKTVSSPFVYNFNAPGILDETGSMNTSSSPYWWLNSGGQLVMEGGVGKTEQGPLKTGQPWQLLYALSSAVDTGNGSYPQNLFRLVTRSTWMNFDQQVKFKITKINMTDTSNRDGYSGVLLFNRYRDEDNLYYSGIRMDGSAVIKKKINGVYYTLAQTQVFNSDSGYEKNTNPNLIPGNRWMGLKSETKDLSDGGVQITLWLDKTNTGSWTKILTATDRAGAYGGTAVIKGPGSVGIRTDYMDVWFDDFKVTAL